MRVIAGSAKGRRLKPPPGYDTRPTADRVKESAFNIIQGYISRASVLDLFAGTGALGIEALSRGAEFAVFVDASAEMTRLISENLELTRLAAQSAVVAEDAERFLRRTEESFGLILLDPPYNKGYLPKCMELLAERKLLIQGGIVVAETERGGEAADFPGFTKLREAAYGKTVVTVYAAAEGETHETGCLSGNL